jgi:hypothetical protein
MRLKHVILVNESTVSAVISKNIVDVIICRGVKFFQLRTKLITSGSILHIEKLKVVNMVKNFIP